MAGAAVVAGGERDVQRLVVRVLAGLAGLPADQVDDLGLPVEDRSCSRSSTAARSSIEVRAQLLLRAAGPGNASSTSPAVDCGMVPIGWPLNGQYVGTLVPLVATQPVGEAADERGSRA